MVDDCGLPRKYNREGGRVKLSDAAKKLPTFKLTSTTKSSTINRKEYVRFRQLSTDGSEKYNYIQDDEIQRLESFSEIKQYFEYTDKWGDRNYPIDESVSNLDFEMQIELAEGLRYARDKFGLEELPTVKIGNVEKGAIAQYNEKTRTITIRKNIKVEESFPAAVHEMTHFAKHIKRKSAEEIYDLAVKELKLRKNSKDLFNLSYALAGAERGDADEILAYSVEWDSSKKKNRLSEIVSRIWYEKVQND